MAKTNYRVIPQKDMSYGVELTEPSRGLRTVTGFQTEAKAEAWIAEQKQLEDAAERGLRNSVGERED
jgi:hypothetical protein